MRKNVKKVKAGAYGLSGSGASTRKYIVVLSPPIPVAMITLKPTAEHNSVVVGCTEWVNRPHPKIRSVQQIQIWGW